MCLCMLTHLHKHYLVLLLYFCVAQKSSEHTVSYFSSLLPLPPNVPFPYTEIPPILVGAILPVFFELASIFFPLLFHANTDMQRQCFPFIPSPGRTLNPQVVKEECLALPERLTRSPAAASTGPDLHSLQTELLQVGIPRQSPGQQSLHTIVIVSVYFQLERRCQRLTGFCSRNKQLFSQGENQTKQAG